MMNSNASNEHRESDTSLDVESRRKQRHTAAEQRRRDAIKRGYDLLASVVPTCQPEDPIICTRITKANILHKSIAYIQLLEADRKKLNQELNFLQRDITCCEALHKTYQEMLSHHVDSKSKHETVKEAAEAKFLIFRAICDQLFHTFKQCISVSSTSGLKELCASVIGWVENHCNPEKIKNLISNALFASLPLQPTNIQNNYLY